MRKRDFKSTDGTQKNKTCGFLEELFAFLVPLENFTLTLFINHEGKHSSKPPPSHATVSSWKQERDANCQTPQRNLGEIPKLWGQLTRSLHLQKQRQAAHWKANTPISLSLCCCFFFTVSGWYTVFHICFIKTIIICGLSKLFSKDKTIMPRTSKSSPLFHICKNYLVFQMILCTFNHYRLIRWHTETSKTLKS